MSGRVFPTHPLSFEPERWNPPSVVETFNCYSYALNTQDFGWLPLGGNLNRSRQIVSYPQSASFHMRKPPSLEGELALVIDGLERIRAHQYGPHEAHIIAFDCAHGHFFRLDANHVWSHKNGVRPATDRDEAGHALLDLEAADFEHRRRPEYGDTRSQVLYFKVPKHGIAIRTPEERNGLRPRIPGSNAWDPLKVYEPVLGPAPQRPKEWYGIEAMRDPVALLALYAAQKDWQRRRKRMEQARALPYAIARMV